MIPAGIGPVSIPHNCAWCGAPCKEPFCKKCYGVIDAGTKASMRALIEKAAPKMARCLGLTRLEELKTSGAHGIPERRTERGAEREAA